MKVLKICLLFSIAGLLAVVCKTAWETTLTSHWKKKSFKLGCFFTFTFNFSSAAHIQARPKSSIFSHNFSNLWLLFSPYPYAVVTWPIADHTSPSHSPTPCLSPWPEPSSHQPYQCLLGFPLRRCLVHPLTSRLTDSTFRALHRPALLSPLSLVLPSMPSWYLQHLPTRFFYNQHISPTGPRCSFPAKWQGHSRNNCLTWGKITFSQALPEDSDFHSHGRLVSGVLHRGTVCQSLNISFCRMLQLVLVRKAEAALSFSPSHCMCVSSSVCRYQRTWNKSTCWSQWFWW